MMVNHKRALLYLFLFVGLLGACVEGEEAVVVNTAVPTPPPTTEPTVTETAVPVSVVEETAVPENTETPLPIAETPTPVSTSTRTPTTEPTQPPASSISGMVFITPDQELWWIDADSEPVQLFEQSGILEPDGFRLLISRDFDIWLMDLETGSEQNLTNTLDVRECCAQWWPSEPDKFLVAQYDPVREFQLGQMVVVTLEGERQILAEGTPIPYLQYHLMAKQLLLKLGDYQLFTMRMAKLNG